MSGWECYRCGFVFEGASPPEECPSCHYYSSIWLQHLGDEPTSVKSFVRKRLLSLDAASSAWQAAKLMRGNNSGSVMVTSGGRVVGIVTERDILYKVAAEDLPASKVLLRKIMSSPVMSVPAETSVSDALKLMERHRIRRLLVTEDGRPVGMVSQRSVIGDSLRVAKPLGELEPPD
ncbi:MAG: CBS domain-containing protein [Nitrososphaerota archaeon]|nr:CBS domain-containing protein [Nitrososphaerota archaeon]MDG6939581.1 CBS domain-containing protein [Nitrososphaerota archaeon]